MTYKEQLLNPEWQKKRLHILERDKFACQICLDTETTLHVHHTEYDKTFTKKAWEYPDYVYKTLCSDCHAAITTHLKEYNNDKNFDVLKIKVEKGIKVLIVYSEGEVFLMPTGKDPIYFYESTLKKFVHFVINNWLKNG